ncbi:hypothetical protein CRUP_035400 [Coryphaenoides rupestris]|nr:hypothetical protein CRUP_035400 [Coryphaenoides rupestris]
MAVEEEEVMVVVVVVVVVVANEVGDHHNSVFGEDFLNSEDFNSGSSEDYPHSGASEDFLNRFCSGDNHNGVFGEDYPHSGSGEDYPHSGASEDFLNRFCSGDHHNSVFGQDFLNSEDFNSGSSEDYPHSGSSEDFFDGVASEGSYTSFSSWDYYRTDYNCDSFNIVSIEDDPNSMDCSVSRGDVSASYSLQVEDPDWMRSAENKIAKLEHLQTNGLCAEFQLVDCSLLELIWKAEHRMLPLRQIRDTLELVASVLVRLDDHGIIHGNVNPENIMVSGYREVKLIDFGDRPQTLPYRSPEILLGLPFTGAIDMWSLGCVAAELLTGRLIYPCHSEYDMAGNVRGEPIPPSFLDLLKRMLELNPDERITPRELLKHPFICQESQDQPSSSSTVQQPAPCEDSSSSSSTVQQPAPCEDSSSSSSTVQPPSPCEDPSSSSSTVQPPSPCEDPSSSSSTVQPPSPCEDPSSSSSESSTDTVAPPQSRDRRFFKSVRRKFRRCHCSTAKD